MTQADVKVEGKTCLEAFEGGGLGRDLARLVASGQNLGGEGFEPSFDTLLTFLVTRIAKR